MAHRLVAVLEPRHELGRLGPGGHPAFARQRLGHRVADAAPQRAHHAARAGFLLQHAADFAQHLLAGQVHRRVGSRTGIAGVHHQVDAARRHKVADRVEGLVRAALIDAWLYRGRAEHRRPILQQPAVIVILHAFGVVALVVRLTHRAHAQLFGVAAGQKRILAAQISDHLDVVEMRPQHRVQCCKMSRRAQVETETLVRDDDAIDMRRDGRHLGGEFLAKPRQTLRAIDAAPKRIVRPRPAFTVRRRIGQQLVRPRARRLRVVGTLRQHVGTANVEHLLDRGRSGFHRADMQNEPGFVGVHRGSLSKLRSATASRAAHAASNRSWSLVGTGEIGKSPLSSANNVSRSGK